MRPDEAHFCPLGVSPCRATPSLGNAGSTRLIVRPVLTHSWWEFNPGDLPGEPFGASYRPGGAHSLCHSNPSTKASGPRMQSQKPTHGEQGRPQPLLMGSKPGRPLPVGAAAARVRVSLSLVHQGKEQL